jgi:hypothetical protein
MTSKPKPWGDREIAEALRLQSAGLTFADIGRALGRTGRGVQSAIDRRRGGYAGRDIYDAPPIGPCPEARRLRENAIQGSAMLLEAIQRAAA